ncbi:hypothetical protein D4R99_00840 [bacterium]|nr:MAG: hypothetical protein D4R99_00840 [bacterium]
MYKGTIIENSLKDRSILDQIEVIKRYNLEDWTLDDVLVKNEQIQNLQNCLDKGPWYIHLWEEGKDNIKVIFRDKIFDIKFSDKSSWINAVAYGKSIGIPEEQLDFLID